VAQHFWAIEAPSALAHDTRPQVFRLLVQVGAEGMTAGAIAAAVGGNIKVPNEQITRNKTMRAITIEAAQLSGMDNMVGSIAAGKKADFAVLDHGPFRVGVTGLHSMRAEGKIFDGKFAAS
jgi:predicted amidohydrolase YtcJ